MDQTEFEAQDDREGDVQQGVVAVVVRGGRLLLIQRAPGILAGGAWCFVGGSIEAGESQEDAIRREFREEVGVAAQPVQKIWEYRRPDGKLLLHWWLAGCEHRELHPNPAEVSDIGWFTPEEIPRLPKVLESNLFFMRSKACKVLLEGIPDETSNKL